MRYLAFLFSTFLLSCTTANLLDPPSVPKERIDKKKIALVGFHPYSTESVGNKLDGWINTPCKSEISLRYGTDLKSAFFKGRRNVPSDHRAAYPLPSQVISVLSYGSPIAKFPASGLDERISEGNIQGFIDFSYKHMAAGALPDICEVLDFDSQTKTLRMKKREVDYYVVGIFTPVFFKATVLGAVVYAATFPFSILSLGLIPSFFEQKTESYFRVYDSKLNIVKELETGHSFWQISALWVFPSERNKAEDEFSYDPAVWEKDVEELDKAWKP